MSDQACKTCKRIIEGKECAVCKSNELTRSWKGVLIVYDADSNIAKGAGQCVPGKYAMHIV